MVYLRLGRHAEAAAAQRESLAICRELDDRQGEVEALRDLGDALVAVARHRQARAAWQEALAICEALQIGETDQIRDRLARLPPEVSGPAPHAAHPAEGPATG